MKALEKKDITKGGVLEAVEEEPTVRELCEVEKILQDTDVNTLSPMQALLLLRPRVRLPQYRKPHTHRRGGENPCA